MSDPLLNAKQLKSFVDAVDAAELAANGNIMESVGALSRMLREEPYLSLSTLAAFLQASLNTLAAVSGRTVEEMATELRKNGAL